MNKPVVSIPVGLPWWLRGKESVPMQETWVQSLGWDDPLEKETANHSSILTWEIPWTEDPGGLQSMGSKKSHTIPVKFFCEHIFPLLLGKYLWVSI